MHSWYSNLDYKVTEIGKATPPPTLLIAVLTEAEIFKRLFCKFKQSFEFIYQIPQGFQLR